MTLGMWLAAAGFVFFLAVVWAACVLTSYASDEPERDAMAKADRERLGL